MAERQREDQLFPFWSERTIPRSMLPLLDGRAFLIGSADASPGDPLAMIAESVAIIASARIRYDAALMQKAPGLRVISRTGTGVDNIDLIAATERGIVVCNVPDGPTTSTAEYTLALILAVAKRLKPAEVAFREGQFDHFNSHDAMELRGRVLGIVGLGAIGRLVAGFGIALGMRVIAFDPYVDVDLARALHVELRTDLHAMLGEADIVSLHAPLTGETIRMIDGAAIRAMRPGVVFINTARGGLVDEVALVEALDSGHVGGVGMDVFDPEPPLATNPLLDRPEVIATPHLAAATIAGRERLWSSAIQQALQVLSGETPDHVVNVTALGKTALVGSLAPDGG